MSTTPPSLVRTIAGAIVGFVAWLVAWFGGEALLGALAPVAYGAHQQAFERALVEGHGGFEAEPAMLAVHLVLATVASVFAGWVSAMVAGEGRRAPSLLGCLLLALGSMKAVMSWPYVPLWFHIVFTALPLPLALLGGRLRRP